MGLVGGINLLSKLGISGLHNNEGLGMSWLGSSALEEGGSPSSSGRSEMVVVMRSTEPCVCPEIRSLCNVGAEDRKEGQAENHRTDVVFHVGCWNCGEVVEELSAACECEKGRTGFVVFLDAGRFQEQAQVNEELLRHMCFYPMCVHQVKMLISTSPNTTRTRFRCEAKTQRPIDAVVAVNVLEFGWSNASGRAPILVKLYNEVANVLGRVATSGDDERNAGL